MVENRFEIDRSIALSSPFLADTRNDIFIEIFTLILRPYIHIYNILQTRYWLPFHFVADILVEFEPFVYSQLHDVSEDVRILATCLPVLKLQRNSAVGPVLRLPHCARTEAHFTQTRSILLEAIFQCFNVQNQNIFVHIKENIFGSVDIFVRGLMLTGIRCKFRLLEVVNVVLGEVGLKIE